MDQEQIPHVNTVSSQNNTEDKPKKWKVYFDIASWVFLFFFLPYTAIIILSQSTVPGDTFYPMKRAVESMILAAASLNPGTKALFHVDLADRRFSEAERLLIAKADASSLKDFLDEVHNSQDAITTLDDPGKKEELKNELLGKIDEYQSRLQQVKEKTTSPQQTGFSSNDSPTPLTPTPYYVLVTAPPVANTPQNTQTTIIREKETRYIEREVRYIYITLPPGQVPTSTPIPPTRPSSQRGPTHRPPTSTPTYPPTPTPVVPTPTPIPLPQQIAVGAINQTSNELDDIRDQLLSSNSRSNSQAQPTDTPIPQPTATVVPIQSVPVVTTIPTQPQSTNPGSGRPRGRGHENN